MADVASSATHKIPRSPKNIFDMPPEITTKAEWIKMNTEDFLHFFTLFFNAEVGHECTIDKCPKMTAGPNYEFLWAEDEYKNNPSSLPAKVYIDKVRIWAEALLAGFGSLASPDATPPENFQRTCVQIWSRVLRVVMHIYWHHWETIVMRDSDVLLNNYTKHFIVYALKYKLLIRFDAIAPIFDLLGTILPPASHKQLQDMETKAKGGSKASAAERPTKLKEKPKQRERKKRGGFGRVALGKMKEKQQQLQKQEPDKEWTGDEFDFEDEETAAAANSKDKKRTGKGDTGKKTKEKEGKKEKGKDKDAQESNETDDIPSVQDEKSMTVVQIPLELLNSFSGDNDPTLPSPTVFVRRSLERTPLPSLPPTFNPEEALNRLYAMEEGGEGGGEEGEEEEGDEDGGGPLGGIGGRHSSKGPFRRSRFLTQEEMEEFMKLKEDERREWVKRRQQLPNSLSDDKVRYEGMKGK